MEISRFASPNVNHSYGKCESIRPANSQYFMGLCESVQADCESLMLKTFFFGPNLFSRKVLCNKEQQCELIALKYVTHL